MNQTQAQNGARIYKWAELEQGLHCQVWFEYVNICHSQTSIEHLLIMNSIVRTWKHVIILHSIFNSISFNSFKFMFLFF